MQWVRSTDAANSHSIRGLSCYRGSRFLLTETVRIEQNRAENAKPSQFSRVFLEVPGGLRRDKGILQAVKEDLTDRLSDFYPGIQIEQTYVEKAQGESYEGIRAVFRYHPECRIKGAGYYRCFSPHLFSSRRIGMMLLDFFFFFYSTRTGISSYCLRTMRPSSSTSFMPDFTPGMQGSQAPEHLRSALF